MKILNFISLNKKREYGLVPRIKKKCEFSEPKDLFVYQGLYKKVRF